MPRLSIVQTNFTAGEISPRLMGRTDIDRYNNAARALLNAYPVIHGGAKRRAGTRFFKAAKLGAKKSRLIPFIFSRDVAYMLEVGDTYIRVHGAGGVDLGIELPTSYTEAMLPDIDYAQGADTMFVSHPTVPIQRLRRITSAPAFDVSAAPFTAIPFEEQGHALAANLTLSAATVGAGRTATASVGVFLPTDIGRRLISGAGLGTITAWTSATSVTVTITNPYASTSLASGAWYLDVSPQAILKPTAKTPAGGVCILYAGKTRAADMTLSALTGTGITITASAAVFAAGDVGKKFFAGDSLATITAFTDSTHVTASVNNDFTSLSVTQGGYGMSEDTWRAEDVGKYVRITSTGIVQITAVTTTQATTTIVAELANTVISPPLSWTLESALWNATNGYPRTVTLHEQRLVAAGTAQKPQTVWGSRSGLYLDFTKGTTDDASYSFTIAADEVNPIGYLASMRNLVVHTYGGEFSIQGGIEKPVTPTNVRVRPESNHGSKGVRPVKVGTESVFVQRSGRKVRALGYRVEADGYTAPDLVTLAEHITAGGVTELAYQQEPDLLLWGVRGDGALLSSTLDRSQSVDGWAAHITDGAFESVATIPNGDHDETWVVVRRTVNGTTVRYLEIFDDSFAPALPGAAFTGYPPAPAVTVYGYTVDAGMAFDNAGGQTVFNVPHLIGKTVDIVADGAVQPQQTVDGSGNVTLTRPSFRTLIGLHFDSQIGLLTPEVGTGTGTAQGNSMRTSEITMRFLNTIGAAVFDGDGVEQDVPFRQFGPAILDKAPAPFTGNVRFETLGWERGRCEFTIVQNQPLPMHLLSVVRKFQVND
jgi:hypothetical protein